MARSRRGAMGSGQWAVGTHRAVLDTRRLLRKTTVYFDVQCKVQARNYVYLFVDIIK